MSASTAKVHHQTAPDPHQPDWMVERVQRAGLRATRQRVALARLLFSSGHRHISAEALHEEAQAGAVPVSLATVYNTLHQFTAAGLLREIAVDGARTYFDTNLTEHYHFFVEGENRILDIDQPVALNGCPAPPPGMEVTSIELVVRVCRVLK